MKNSNLFIIYLAVLSLFGCQSNKNILNEDDYKIMEIVIQKTVLVDNFSLLENDLAMRNLNPNTPQYREKLNELYENQNYESDYYYSLEDSLFVFKNNFYLEKLFKENDFDGNTKNITLLKLISPK